MAALLESLAELENWEAYLLYTKERLKQLPEGDQPVYISKKKIDFEDKGKKWKGRAVLFGQKGLMAVNKVKKDGVQFHEGTARATGKDFEIKGIDKGLLKGAALTLKRMKLGYKIAGVDETDETDDTDSEESAEPQVAAGSASATTTTDPGLLSRRLETLREEVRRNEGLSTKTTEPFIKQAQDRVKRAEKLITADPTKAAELIQEGEEFIRQAMVGFLEGGKPTEAAEIEDQRQELIAEVAAAVKIGDPANTDIMKQAEKALDAALAAVGKKDYAKARLLLDAVEQQLSLVVEGPDETGDPDLVGLGDWKSYRKFLKAQLKRMPKENSAIFISRQKQTFTINGKEFKANAILFGPKGKITAQVLKRDGTLCMEGLGRVDGTALKVGGIKASLIKGAAKLMIKLRLGKKLVPEGVLPPEDDASPESAKDDKTGSWSLDREVKQVAESLVKLREALDKQKASLPALAKDAADKRKIADTATAKARAAGDAGKDATKDWDVASKAVQAADAAQYSHKNIQKDHGRAQNSLREMTERLHSIKGSADANKVKQEQLKKLKAEIAAKQLDAAIANIDPADPKSGKIIADQIKKRFGIKFELNRTKMTIVDGKQVFKDNDTKIDPKKEAETLKELYLTMSKAPEFPTSHLKKLTVSLRPADANSEGGVYYGDSKTAEVTCRRPKESFDYGRQLESAWTANNDPINYFDWATLHEVAHAVDAKYKFMGGRQSGAKYGGWIEYGNKTEPLAQIVADEFGKTLAGPAKAKLVDYASKRIKAKPGAGPAPTTPEETRVQQWVDAVRHTKGLWWDAGASASRAIDKRVYQEAYGFAGGWWNSYELAARSNGIHGYQFRAPGEWFAELYAAYYSDKLKSSHPIVPDLAKLEAPKK